jgi:hypothetical protein
MGHPTGRTPRCSLLETGSLQGRTVDRKGKMVVVVNMGQFADLVVTHAARFQPISNNLFRKLIGFFPGLIGEFLSCLILLPLPLAHDTSTLVLWCGHCGHNAVRTCLATDGEPDNFVRH